MTEDETKILTVEAALDGYSIDRGIYFCSKTGIGMTTYDDSHKCSNRKTVKIYCKTWHYLVLTCSEHQSYFLEQAFRGAFKEVV